MTRSSSGLLPVIFLLALEKSSEAGLLSDLLDLPDFAIFAVWYISIFLPIFGFTSFLDETFFFLTVL